jgi:hypothetical protein
MTDNNRELLTLAAKAADIELRWVEPKDDDGEAWCFIPSAKPPHDRRKHDADRGEIWDPLTEDGDALRLLAAMPGLWGLQMKFGRPTLHADFGLCAKAIEDMGEGVDRAAALRRAIVRAAAELGRAS